MDTNSNSNNDRDINHAHGNNFIESLKEKISPDVERRLVFAAPDKKEPAAPPALKKIIYGPYACEDCGVILEEKRVVNLTRARQPSPHWSVSCSVCKKWQNPVTGEFNLTNVEKNAILTRLKSKRNK